MHTSQGFKEKQSICKQLKKMKTQRSVDEQEVKVGRMCGFKVEAQQLVRGWRPLPPSAFGGQSTNAPAPNLTSSHHCPPVW